MSGISQTDSSQSINRGQSPDPPFAESKSPRVYVRDGRDTVDVNNGASSRGHGKSTGPQKSVWSRIQSNGSMVLRALGLGLLSNVVRRWFRGQAQEPLKIVLRQDRIVALLRSLVHIVPIGIALWLVTLNWVTYYVGSFTYAQVYYQIGAKALEILIQASLAAIVLGYVRHELVLGKGLPFGTLFSGLQVNQISYLWSMEFWGSIGSKTLSLHRKMFLFVFLLVIFVLAAAAGPSTAVLLIPRRDYWPAGSTHVWIDAAKDDIWPTQLNASMVPANCSVSTEATVSNSCPSSEWQMIDTWIKLAKLSIPNGFHQLVRGIQAPTAVEFSGRASLRPLYPASLSTNLPGQGNSSEYFQVSIFTTQQSVVADTLANTAAIWVDSLNDAHFPGHGVSPFDVQNTVHTIRQDYLQPYTATICIMDSITSRNDTRPVSVPINAPIQYNPVPSSLRNLTHSIGKIPVIDYLPLKRAQLLDIEGSESDFRLKWFELPADYFNVSGLGAAIILPSLYSAGSDNTEVVVCNLNAGWGVSSINITDAGGLSAASSLVESGPSHVRSPVLSDTSVTPESRYEEVVDVAVRYDLPNFPESIIYIQEGWAEYLNPRIPALNTTVIDYVMKANGLARNADILAQDALGALLTNGLARVGGDHQFQGNPHLKKGPTGAPELDGTYWLSGKGDFFTVDPEESKNWVKLRVDSNIQGYAYNTHGSGPKVAIAFLLGYCAMALAYTVYTGVSGNSSTAWDSIAEVTALAMNSTPTRDLQNTCGGISETRTFKTPVRIVVRQNRGEDEGEHLELVFGDRAGGQFDGSDTIKSNRAYGRLPWREADDTP